MPIGEICNRQVVFARRETTIPEAAGLMRQYHVGALVVVDGDGERRVPVGMVTDRDLVMEIIAPGVWVGAVTIGEIMSPDIVTARETDGIYETIRRMRVNGIRRLPVVDAEGVLQGILTADDLIELLGDEISELVRLVSREQENERELRTSK